MSQIDAMTYAQFITVFSLVLFFSSYEMDANYFDVHVFPMAILLMFVEVLSISLGGLLLIVYELIFTHRYSDLEDNRILTAQGAFSARVMAHLVSLLVVMIALFS